jgi:predicted ATPase/DNA-binding XRE family transcriptional regulator
MEKGFGTLLRRFRLRAGVSQEELGARAHLSAETIGALERGTRRAPYRTTVDLLSEALALQPSECSELEAAAARARGRSRQAAPRPSAPVGNLPSPVTSFVGRDDEIRELRELLGRHRLVTITGTGGAGKTRTAIEVATAVSESFPDGVWFVDLAVLDVGAPIEVRITSTLGLRLPDAGDRAALAQAIRARSLLIVMDNCEHVLESVAPTVSALLKECPALKIIATSRERLSLTGEVAFRIQNLSVPPADAQLSADTAGAFSAIELFTERAILADHRFELRDEIVPLVASICRRLDGLALAVEIAAARSPLGLSELDEMIRSNATSVSSGLRDASPRHHTLAATIAWSYGLLGEREQRVLRELSVFAASFTPQAAHAVCASDGLDHAALGAVLRALCEKSLLNAEIQKTEVRFALLQSIREYAHRELLERGEASGALQRHDEYFAAFSDDVRERRNFFTPAQLLAHVALEIDNIDAALERSLQPNGEPLVAARITAGLRTYWQLRGRIRESMQNATSLIGRIDADVHPGVVATLHLVCESGLAGLDRVNANLRAIDLFTRVRNPDYLAGAYASMGEAYVLLNHTSKARTALGWAWTFAVLAQAQPFQFVRILVVRGGLDRREGKLDDARARFNAALAMIGAADETNGALALRMEIAEMEFQLGNPRAALAIMEELDAVVRPMGFEVPYLCNLCAYRIAVGEIAAAMGTTRNLIALAREHQPMMLVTALQHVATLAAIDGRLALAARLRGYADERARRMGFEREPTEEHCYAIGTRALSERCREDELSMWTSEGARFSEDDAIAAALTI